MSLFEINICQIKIYIFQLYLYVKAILDIIKILI